MTIEDKYACAELIQAWGLYRDLSRWPELLATFHPEGEIAISWFRGPFSEFVERCKRGGPSKHLISPALVRVAGDRAVAETSVVILVRQDIEGIAVDMTSRGRFLDRLERRQATWKILERAAIYEQDSSIRSSRPMRLRGCCGPSMPRNIPRPTATWPVGSPRPDGRWRSRCITMARCTQAISMRATRRGSRGGSPSGYIGFAISSLTPSGSG